MNAAGSHLQDAGRVVALCGGIGGAKLALGLSKVVPDSDLTIIVNTGDDFRHFGLHISPDIDTVCYTLSGVANQDYGWGRRDESWRFMQTVKELGGETWFSLGDTDLATSAIRTARLADGDRLTEITGDIAQALGIKAAILPATDHPLETVVHTDEGILPFQRYFVGRHCEPRVMNLSFEGAENAEPSAEVRAALTDERLSAVVICPSNPYLSIDPMLAMADFRSILENVAAPVVAVSPLVGNRAIKGPLAKMMGDLGLPVELQSIADHYKGLLDVLIVDETDGATGVSGPQLRAAQTVMRSLEDRVALADAVLAAANEFRKVKAK